MLAVYPRQFDKGMCFESEEHGHGAGIVTDCHPTKDNISKENLNVITAFTQPQGSKTPKISSRLDFFSNDGTKSLTYLTWLLQNTQKLNSEKFFFEDKNFGMSQHDQARSMSGYLKIEINDSGANIDRTFHQFHSPNDNRLMGSAIPFSFTFQLCKKMGGEIKMHRLEGLGTTFVILIKTIRKFPEGFSVIKTKEVVKTNDSLEKILIVEDIALIQDSARFYLPNVSYMIDIAYSTSEAINKVIKEGFNYIIVDLESIKKDAIYMLKQIRDIEINLKRKAAKICLINNQFLEDDKYTLMNKYGEIKADLCIEKPLKFNMFENLFNSNQTSI